MNIAQEIQRLQTAKSSIRNAINLKGVNVPESESISNFPTYIELIGIVPDPDVRFYNTDGSILFGFDRESFLQLGANPPVPSWVSYLDADWTLTYNQIIGYLNYHQKVDVSLLYRFGSSRIFITVQDTPEKTVKFNVQFTGADSDKSTWVTWGDREGDSYLDGKRTIEHTYANPGKYIVTLAARTSRYQLGLGGQGAPLLPTGSSGFTIDRVDVGLDGQMLRAWGFSDMPELKEFIVSSGVVGINNSGCRNSGLEFLCVPGTTLGSSCLRDCSSLKVLILSENVGKIEQEACKNCVALESVWITDTCTSIGPSAFQGCLSLINVYIGRGVTSMSQNCFADTPIRDIKLSPNLATIGATIFSGCSSLEEVTFSGVAAPTINGGSLGCGHTYTANIPTGSLGSYTSALAADVSANLVTFVEI